MTRLGLLAVIAIVFAFVGGPRPALAAESYDNCSGTIASLPAVISTQGTWCMKSSLATAMASGSAITINTNNVTIDCNGFKLDGLAAGAGTVAYGITANNRLNLTVRNCDIRGFYTGLEFQSSGDGGYTVEDNVFYGNRSTGMVITGNGSLIQRNRIYDCGGSTSTGQAIGILTGGSVDIENNLISGAVARSGGNGNAYGIDSGGNPDGRIIGNAVRGLAKDGTGITVGIVCGACTYAILRKNDVVGDGSAGSYGLECPTAKPSASDNVVSAFATAIFNCSDSGGNDIVP